MVKLLKVNLDENSLTSLPDLQKLKRLSDLSVAKNKLTKVADLDQLTGLVMLDLHQNLMEEFD